MRPDKLAALRAGLCIPAHPLALDAERRLDERSQRALSRYYLDAGVGGLAVGVHTTQFTIRAHGLLRPVLQLAAEEARAHASDALLVAGVCGARDDALADAALAAELGYDLGLLSFAALPDASEDELIEHARAVGDVLPLCGFYLQPAVGGRHLSRGFWRRFAELGSVLAIKVAPFDRYRTNDVLRGVAQSSRAAEIALYTGNDDAIVADLCGPFSGGLLGHWAVWTKSAVELFERVQAERARGVFSAELLALGRDVTDMNAALFDAAHGFRGCIAGVQAVLHAQGLLATPHCLDPHEQLSAGQAEELARVQRAYPQLVDDAFIAQNVERWRS